MGCCNTKEEKEIENKNNQNELNILNFNNTPFFSLVGLNTCGKVVDLYDGDTCTAIVPLFNKYYKFQIRLAGIDTCELKSKNPINKEYAFKARNRLYNLITNEEITQEITRKNIKDKLSQKNCIIFFKFDKFDKYGRLLGWLFGKESDAISFNEILIKENLAYKYEGKTKLTEEQQLKLLSI